jgi:hypothetical protein
MTKNSPPPQKSGTVVKTTTHTVKAIEYEIRSIQDLAGWTVASYRDGKQISPRYSISCETGQDFHHYRKQRPIDALIELAKSDLDAGIVK